MRRGIVVDLAAHWRIWCTRVLGGRSWRYAFYVTFLV